MSIITSVIICNYNNAKFLGRTIRSCLKQSIARERYEIIVVDDASTDNSREVIASFGKQIVTVFLERNVGVAEASNVGIKTALGSYIIRVDADDYISEHTLLMMTEILNKNPSMGFIFADHFRVDRQEFILSRVNIDSLDKLLRHGAGILFRKSYLEAIGLYDPILRNAEDFDLLKRYIRKYEGYHLPYPCYRYRQHGGNMTADDKERERWEQIADAKNTNRQ